jgi:hypothetical protein
MRWPGGADPQVSLRHLTPVEDRLNRPLVLNVALHGMEQAAGVRYRRCNTYGAEVSADSPTLVRYADDFVVLCRKPSTRHQRRIIEGC